MGRISTSNTNTSNNVHLLKGTEANTRVSWCNIYGKEGRMKKKITLEKGKVGEKLRVLLSLFVR